MSILVKNVNMSGLTTNSTFSVQLKNVGPDSNPAFTQNPPHLILYNESGFGLIMSFQVGAGTHVVPAGAWFTCEISPGESQINFAVLYGIQQNNQPVSSLAIVYFSPGEALPQFILGNSPIQGGVSTSTVTTLINDGSAPGTQVIEMTPNDALSSTVVFDNSGNVTIKGDNVGVLTTLLQLVAGASPAVKLFASGQTTEVLGALKVDQNANVLGSTSLDNGTITTNGTGSITVNVNLTVKGSSSLDNGSITTNGSGALTAGSVSSPGNISTTGTGAIQTTGSGNLSIKGSSSLDNAAITTNGSGNITTSGSISTSGTGNISTTGTGNLSIKGTSSLDNANITTDGTGIITMLASLFTGSVNHPKISGDGNGFMNFDIPNGTRKLQIGDTAHGITANDGITANSSTDAFLAPNGAISIGGRQVSFNGNTSGSGIMYQILDGAGFKLTYIHLSAFNNSGGTNTDVALPVAYVEGADFFVSNIGQIQALASGVAQTFQIVTALAAGGGTNTNQTTLNNYSWAHVGGTTIDTIRFSSGIAGAHSGAILMFGR